MGDVWVVHRTNDPRFAFHITIERSGEPSPRLLAQDRWPAAGRALFCVRMGEEVPDELDLEEEIERVPIAAVERIGRKLAVVLDRKRFKRSDFLFLEKPRKGADGSSRSSGSRRPRPGAVARGSNSRLRAGAATSASLSTAPSAIPGLFAGVEPSVGDWW